MPFARDAASIAHPARCLCMAATQAPPALLGRTGQPTDGCRGRCLQTADERGTLQHRIAELEQQCASLGQALQAKDAATRQQQAELAALKLEHGNWVGARSCRSVPVTEKGGGEAAGVWEEVGAQALAGAPPTPPPPSTARHCTGILSHPTCTQNHACKSSWVRSSAGAGVQLPHTCTCRRHTTRATTTVLPHCPPPPPCPPTPTHPGCTPAGGPLPEPRGKAAGRVHVLAAGGKVAA